METQGTLSPTRASANIALAPCDLAHPAHGAPSDERVDTMHESIPNSTHDANAEDSASAEDLAAAGATEDLAQDTLSDGYDNGDDEGEEEGEIVPPPATPGTAEAFHFAVADEEWSSPGGAIHVKKGDTGQQVLDNVARGIDEVMKTMANARVEFGYALYAVRKHVIRNATDLPDWGGRTQAVRTWFAKRLDLVYPVYTIDRNGTPDPRLVQRLQGRFFAFSPSMGRTREVLTPDYLNPPVPSEDFDGYRMTEDPLSYEELYEEGTAESWSEETATRYTRAYEQYTHSLKVAADFRKSMGDLQSVASGGKTRRVRQDPGDVTVVRFQDLHESYQRGLLEREQAAMQADRDKFRRQVQRDVLDLVRANVPTDHLRRSGIEDEDLRGATRKRTGGEDARGNGGGATGTETEPLPTDNGSIIDSTMQLDRTSDRVGVIVGVLDAMTKEAATEGFKLPDAAERNVILSHLDRITGFAGQLRAIYSAPIAE